MQILDALDNVLADVVTKKPYRVEVWVDPLDEDSDDDAYMTRVVFGFDGEDLKDVYLLGHDQTYEEAREMSIEIYDAVKTLKKRGVSRSITA